MKCFLSDIKMREFWYGEDGGNMSVGTYIPSSLASKEAINEAKRILEITENQNNWMEIRDLRVQGLNHKLAESLEQFINS